MARTQSEPNLHNALAQRVKRVMLLEIILVAIFYLALFGVINSIFKRQNETTAATLSRFQMALDVQSLERLLLQHVNLERSYRSQGDNASYRSLIATHEEFSLKIHLIQDQLQTIDRRYITDFNRELNYVTELDASHHRAMTLLNALIDRPITFSHNDHHQAAPLPATPLATEDELNHLQNQSVNTTIAWRKLIESNVTRLQQNVASLLRLRTIALYVQAFFVISILITVAYLYVLPSFQEILRRLVAKNRQLQEFDDLKTEFLSIASHQLRSPLSELKWTLTLLERERRGKLAERERTLIEKSRESLTVMVKLVANLLNITRIEEGRLVLNLEKTDLTTLIRDTCADVGWQAKEHGVTLDCNLRYKRAMATVDPVLFREVVRNLLDNAIKYNKRGGSVTVTLAKDRDTWVIQIADTGYGMKSHEVKHLFTKFFRGEEARLMEPDGSGLGLYFIKKIIEKQHGRIWVTSEWRKGSTFAFTVPVATSAPLPKPAPHARVNEEGATP